MRERAPAPKERVAPSPDDETVPLDSELEAVFARVKAPKIEKAKAPGFEAVTSKAKILRNPHDPEVLKPRDPLEIPLLREDTVHAIITARALRTRGRQARFSVPEQFVGLLTDMKGETETLLLPGEEATGDFVLHLFRTGTLLAPMRSDGHATKDGFETRAESELGIRLNTHDAEALRTFLANYSSGSAHLSLPVVKSHFEKGVKEALRKHVAKYDVESLLKNAERESAEGEVAKALADAGIPAGLQVLGLDSLKFTSPDLEKAKRKQARAEREAKAKEEAANLEQSIRTQEIEKIKAQAKLKAELTKVRTEQAKTDFESEREVFQQKKAVDLLQQQFEREKAELTSDLKKMHAANEIEIESIKFDEYLKRAQRLREELDDDRIEFYIQQIRDDRLKADLLKRLIERTMTPEQLRELAQLERVRSEQLTPLPPNFGEDELEVQAEVASAGKDRLRDASGRLVRVPASAVEATQARAAGVSRVNEIVDEVEVTRELDDERRMELNHPLMERLDVAPIPPAAVLSDAERREGQRFPLPTQESAEKARFSDNEGSQTEAMFDTQAIQLDEMEEARARESGVSVSTESSHLSVRERENEDDFPRELRYVLMAAGRNIYAAHVDASGKISELERFLDLSTAPLGSLRSISRAMVNGERHLLIGARRGLYSVRNSNRQVKNYPLDAVFNPLTGVNAAVAHDGRFYATHSQFGLLRWAIAAPNQPASRFLTEYTEHAQSIRSIFMDEAYWPTLAVGDRIVAIEHGVIPRIVAVYSGAPSSILLATSLDGHFFAACEDGSIVVWDKRTPDRCERRARTRETLSGATLSTDGKSMVLCSRSNVVRVYDLSRGALARYEAPQEIRVAREFGDYLLGIARNRSALYVWKSFESTTPVCELPLPDACFDVVGV